MKLKKSSHHVPMEIILRQMDMWYHTALGTYVIAAEREELAKYLPHYFGRHLLQIGGPSEVMLFERSPIHHRVRLSPEHVPVFRGPSVQGLFEEIPFLPNRFEVVLLPHVLEFVKNPERVLQQSYTVLAPEGHLVILGFNPCSLWGIVKCFKQRKILPWRGQFHSVFKMRHWLLQQEFEIEQITSLCFRPPVTRKSWLHRWLALEAIGRLLWANCGAVHMIIAKKRVTPLIPLIEPLKSKRVTVGGVARIFHSFFLKVVGWQKTVSSPQK